MIRLMDFDHMHVAYIQAYLPENISVDEHSHSLLLLIDRLRSKYSILQQLLHESYGYGTHMSITSDDPQEQQLIMMIYHVCNMMMDHVRGIEYITYGLQRTDVETYNLAVSGTFPIVLCVDARCL